MTDSRFEYADEVIDDPELPASLQGKHPPIWFTDYDADKRFCRSGMGLTEWCNTIG